MSQFLDTLAWVVGRNFFNAQVSIQQAEARIKRAETSCQDLTPLKRTILFYSIGSWVFLVLFVIMALFPDLPSFQFGKQTIDQLDYQLFDLLLMAVFANFTGTQSLVYASIKKTHSAKKSPD